MHEIATHKDVYPAIYDMLDMGSRISLHAGYFSQRFLAIKNRVESAYDGFCNSLLSTFSVSNTWMMSQTWSFPTGHMRFRLNKNKTIIFIFAPTTLYLLPRPPLSIMRSCPGRVKKTCDFKFLSVPRPRFCCYLHVLREYLHQGLCVCNLQHNAANALCIRHPRPLSTRSPGIVPRPAPATISVIRCRLCAGLPHPNKFSPTL